MMSDRIEQELDKRLRDIAEDVGAATPKPSDDLFARILADAADFAAEGRSPTPVAKRERRWSLGLSAAFPIWSGSAIAVLALGLFVGIGIGYGFGDSAVAFEAFSGDAALSDFDDSFIDFGGPI